ncbi:MAG: DUF1963 domain-containing protein [Pyrinomonadaceae bacterium]|nr:DUF1963 domain-containing protein [Pyrinomonadaceae bacterium]
MNEEIASYLEPLTRVASRLEPKKRLDKASLPLLDSHFGGLPYAEVGEEWPVCPTCQTSLSFICQINTASGFHQQPKGVALLTFFYCWECSPWGLTDEIEGAWIIRTYPEVSEIKAVTLLPKSEQPELTTACVTEMERVLTFPDWDGIGSYSMEAVEASANANPDEPSEAYISTVTAPGGLTDYATVIGGYPRWVQGEATPDCKVCKSGMSLLAQIDTEDEAGIMWGDVGCVYLFYCPEHPQETKLELQCF